MEQPQSTSILGPLLDYYVNRVKPATAISFFVVVNALISIVTWFATDKWADWFTIAGYWVTLTGLIVAFGELYRTRTVASRLREAVRRENERQRGFHYRHCLERAKSMSQRARANVHSMRWSVVVTHLEDLADYLSHINSISPSVDNHWQELRGSLQTWAHRFAASTNDRRCAYNLESWVVLISAVIEQLDGELAPFQFGEVDDDS